MEISRSVVVVTGGGSGIGRALCHRFARDGAAAVVVADIDGAAADRTAGELSGTNAVSAQVDVSVEAQVRDLVERTWADCGPIDLFCANAGVGLGRGLAESNDDWQRSWEINVMHHVYAARALVPRMLERGSGYIVTTASAAGLLTNLDSATYTVTKHAAVAFAEWLAMNYGDQGIGVSCLCPQGVRTPMLMGAGTHNATLAAGGVVEPEFVAEKVVEAVRTGTFLVLPHPEVADYERRRTGDRDRWLAGMRRVRQKLEQVQAEESAGEGQQ